MFVIKPKPTPLYFGYSAVKGGYKHSNMASAFSVAVPRC